MYFLTKIQLLIIILTPTIVSMETSVSENQQDFKIDDSNVKINEEESNGKILYIDDLDLWYEFLNDLFFKLSSYKIQKDTSLFNVHNINDWGLNGKPQGLVINKNNFRKFLNKIARYDVRGVQELKSVKLTEHQLERLNTVLDLTLKQEISVNCTQLGISISGNYISLKNVMDLENIYLYCSREEIEKSLSIKIFAYNTLFIDADIHQHLFPNLKKMLPLIFIAPRWEIIGHRKITLHGIDGDLFKSLSNEDKLHQITKKERLKNGAPGFPGQPGGIFLGIGENFIQGSNLTIVANGGNGGTGEDGAIGKNGSDGRVPLSEQCPGFCLKGKNNGLLCKETCEQKMDRHFLPLLQLAPYPFVLFCNISRNGEKGSQGEDGGNGGVGGNKGYPGFIKIIELGENSKIRNITKFGTKGKDGKGAVGGTGGLEQSFVEGYCKKFLTSKRKPFFNFTSHNIERSPSGNNGTDGTNAEGLKLPMKYDLDNITIDKIINEYKYYFRDNFQKSIHKLSDLKFLQKIENNNYIKKLYNSLGLIDDLKSLESQLYLLNDKFKFSSFYQSLLQRVNKYAKNPKGFDNTLPKKKFLKYVYTATLSGYNNNMKDNLAPNLIIYPVDYLKNLKKDLIDPKNQKLKKKIFLEKIKNYNEDYKDRIIEKSNEAKNLIDNEITNELSVINEEINKNISALLIEIDNLKTLSENKNKELIESKNKLKNVLYSQWVSGIIKTACTIATFFGPVGAVVGVSVGTIYSIVETVSSDEKPAEKISKLGREVLSGAESMKTKINDLMKEKAKNLGYLLEDLSKKISSSTSKDADNYKDLLNYIENAKKEVAKVKNENLSYKSIEKIENNLKKELNTCYQKFANVKVIKDENSNIAINVLDGVAKAATVGTQLTDLYLNYKQYSTKIDEIANSIKENEDKYNELKQIEKLIHQDITPNLKKLFENVEEIINNISTKPKVSLDFFNYQLQNVLSRTKNFIERNIEKSIIRDNLFYCIEKFQRLIPVLISTNNQIEDFKEQENFADYIANINSADAGGIDDMDTDLLILLQDLDVIIYSNFILANYKLAIKAFEQYVFPFAEFYLKNLKLPEHLRFEKNVPDLVEQVEENVNEIIIKLNSYQTQVTNLSDQIREGDFNNKEVSTESFFVWRNEKHRYAIKELLSGKEVILNADISEAPSGYHALKFNKIELDFVTTNLNQSALNYILKFFEIRLTHLGDSHYVYGNKSYLIQTNNVSVTYNLDKNGKGEPTHISQAYKALKNGEHMLSPYALWTVKLDYIVKSDRNVTFDDLEMYNDDVNLELCGHGVYVKNPLLIQTVYEDYYYKSIQTHDLINDVDQ